MIKDKLPQLRSRAERNLGTFSSHYMHPQAAEIFHHYSPINAVDDYVYPELAAIKKYCGDTILDLFNAGDVSQYQYHSTSGSSEAILLSLLILKTDYQARSNDQSSKPNFIIANNAHIAWHKAAQYLDIELRISPIDELNLTMQPQEILSLIDKDTIGICCSLGATTTLLFDPVQQLNDLLEVYYQKTQHFVAIHVDAASGGFIAAFAYQDLIWDFRLPHVTAINVSSHKFGFVYPSLGWLLTRNLACLTSLSHESDYLGQSIKRVSIQFSHSASHLMTQYYYFQSFGKEGYQGAISELLKLSQLLRTELQSLDLIKPLTPTQGISLPGLVFTMTEGYDIKALANALKEKGWYLPTFKLPMGSESKTAARIIIRYGFTAEHILLLANDIKACLEKVTNPDLHLEA